MRSRRLWWIVYAAFSAVVLLALVWITGTLLRLEQAEVDARTDARHEESMRLALWRLDSWLMPHLTRESGRPYFEYQSFYSPQRVYTSSLPDIASGEAVTPSPLLAFESKYIRIHFQMSPSGSLTSPQAPIGALRTFAENGHLSAQRIETNTATLATLARMLRADKVVNCVAESEELSTRSAVEAMMDTHVPRLAAGASSLSPQAQDALSRQEWSKRKGTFQQNIAEAKRSQIVTQPILRRDMATVNIGTFVPLWITPADDTPRDELVFIRRVGVNDEEYYQGFLCDWPQLRESLLNEIKDLFADADLIPMGNVQSPGTVRGAMLATAPVLLQLGDPVATVLPWLSPVRATTVLAWLAVVVGMIAVAFTLRQSIAFGEKRSRFASAVTHELRSPLTTFRMYTEMLATGMVQESDQRQKYLETLSDESGRLANLVENVLSYAQLEEGRRATHRSEMSIDQIVERHQQTLRRRAEQSKMELQIDNAAPDSTMIDTDVDTLGQILFNLVDNACKYAGNADERTIELRFEQVDGRLHTSVRDHGPGIASDRVRTVFNPFERGQGPQNDQPGIGLGLALSRGLARDLGGDLTLALCPDGGACFVVALPLKS